MRVVLPCGPSQSLRLICGPFLSVPFLRFSNSWTVFSGVRSSQTHSPLTCSMGALAQAPKHSTSCMVKSRSGVVSPLLMPRCFSQASMICSEPRSWQGVVPQICRWNLPTLSRLNMVQKEATSQTSISLTSVILATFRIAARERKLSFCFCARCRRGMMAERFQLGGNLAKIFSTCAQFSAVKSKGVESLLSGACLCEKYPPEKENTVLCSSVLLNFCIIIIIHHNTPLSYNHQQKGNKKADLGMGGRQQREWLFIIFKMSNVNRIFSGGKGADNQGRSANLAGSMFKRAPIFNHVATDKSTEASSPFANYNCRSVESLYSADSQSSLPQERLTPEVVRQMVKQQLSKPRQEDDPNRKLILTLQAQLKDVKQKLMETDAEGGLKLQQLKNALRGEMKEEVARMGKQVNEEISNRLRTFFQKANVELKKDILKVAEQEFLSISYGEDLEARLQAIQESLENVNSLIKTKEISSEDLKQKLNSITVNQTLQNRLAKIEKEAQGLKKGLSDCTTRIKQLEEWRVNEISKSTEQTINQLKSKLQKVKEEQLGLLKPIKLFENKSFNYDATLNKLQNKLDQTQLKCDEVKGQLMDLQKSILFNKDLKSSDLKALLSDNQNFDTSMVINNSSLFQASSKKPSSESAQISDFASIQASTSTEYQQIKKSVYQVDSEGYLMDGQRKYLLTESGSMIRLDSEQIKSLLQCKLVQVVDF